MLMCLWIMVLAGEGVRALVIRESSENSNSEADLVFSQKQEERYNARLFESETGALSIQKNARNEIYIRNKSTIELAIFTDSALFNNVKEKYQEEAPDNITEVITDLVLAVVSSVQLYL